MAENKERLDSVLVRQGVASGREKAKELIYEKSYKREYGARPMRRYIEKHIEDKLALMLIEGTLKSGMNITVTAENNEISVLI